MREEVERGSAVSPAIDAHRRELRNHVHVRHDLGDARPLVDAPSAFHQQRLRRHGDAGVARQLVARAFLEREEALAPRHQLEHHALDLQAELPLQLALRDRADPHERIDDRASPPPRTVGVVAARAPRRGRPA